MGAPIDPEYGDDCPACTPQLFEAGKTPLYIKVNFSGLRRCLDDSLIDDFSIWLKQVDGWPCEWLNRDALLCDLPLNLASVTLSDNETAALWFDSFEDPCSTSFVGNPFCQPGDYAYGGTAKLKFLYKSELFGHHFNLVPLENTWAHFWDHPDYTNVFRFCCRQDHTRVHVLFDDNLYDITG